mgnify:CR=1 FL=1
MHRINIEANYKAIVRPNKTAQTWCSVNVPAAFAASIIKNEKIVIILHPTGIPITAN